MKKVKYVEIKVGDKVEYNKKLIEVIKVHHTPSGEYILVRLDFKDGNITMGKGEVELNIE